LSLFLPESAFLSFAVEEASLLVGSEEFDLSFVVLEAVFVFVAGFVAAAFLGTVAAGFGTSFLRTFSLSSGL